MIQGLFGYTYNNDWQICIIYWMFTISNGDVVNHWGSPFEIKLDLELPNEFDSHMLTVNANME